MKVKIYRHYTPFARPAAYKVVHGQDVWFWCYTNLRWEPSYYSEAHCVSNMVFVGSFNNFKFK